MKFSVIYSVDCPREVSIKHFLPSQRKLFDTTEDDEQYEYDYLEGRWAKGKHRKLCAILTRAQFDRFLDDTGLFPEDVETMGSLGAPGFGCGWAPAISFRSEDEDALQNAYVTPVPDFEPKRQDEAWQKRCWDRIRKAVLSVYR